MQRCANMLRSRRLITKAATADPHILLRGPPEAHLHTVTRMQCGEHPTNDRSEHKAMGTHGSGQHAKGGGGSSVHISQNARPATAAAIRTHPRSASQRPRHQIQSKPKIILNLSCLRSQHARLVSARVSASVRQGVLGSCNRAASQAAGRAYRIVLQRSRPRRGRERGLERPPKADIF
jgi:hypothetical protein